MGTRVAVARPLIDDVCASLQYPVSAELGSILQEAVPSEALILMIDALIHKNRATLNSAILVVWAQVEEDHGFT